MELKNCESCGKVFASAQKLCPDCYQKQEEKYQNVKEYLEENPGATVEKVSKDTGVSVELILKFLKEESLNATNINLMSFQLECKKCGTGISHGRYCRKCKNELITGFSANKKKKQSLNARMFIKNRINKRKDNN